MPPAKPLPRRYTPIVTGYKRLSGGNMQVTWSVAPAKVVRRTIPAEAFNPGTVAILTREVTDRYT